MIIGVWNYHESLHKNNYMLSQFTENCLGEDSMLGFYQFYLEAKKKGHTIEILNEQRKIDNYDAFIFINFPNTTKKVVKDALRSNKPKYLLNLECPIIYPATWNRENYNFFKKIFTWKDDLIDNKFFYKINCPSYPLEKIKVDNLFNEKRSLFCVIICSNKSSNHKYDLYRKRIEIIKWFEINKPKDLDFFGYGWNKYIFKGQKVIRALNKINFLTRILSPKYKNYKGEFIGKKHDLLKQYKFSMCIENAKYYPGYITEKIFHCFFALTVPVYLGSDNISDHIPQECFIDLRNFNSYEDLYKYLKNMEEKEYLQYQISIKNFLNSEKFRPFSIEYYVQMLSDNIL